MSSKHHIEQEIKLTAPDQATLDELIHSQLVEQVARPADDSFEPQRFVASYYDTPDWILRELRWSLRTRYEGALHLSTLKRNSTIRNGFSSCEEIEQATENGFKSVACIPEGKISQALHEILPATTPLHARVEVNMQRRKRVLEIGETQLELVTDSGTISGNGKQQDLFEVELERLQGDLNTEPVRYFIQRLVKTFALRPSHLSKHQIGLSFHN